jgi:hypothetical protein
MSYKQSLCQKIPSKKQALTTYTLNTDPQQLKTHHQPQNLLLVQEVNQNLSLLRTFSKLFMDTKKTTPEGVVPAGVGLMLELVSLLSVGL